jgi:repressor LexA
MHIIQQQLLNLIQEDENLGKFSLRAIAEKIGAKGKPQTAKYHLEQLKSRGIIQMNLSEGVLKIVKKGYNLEKKSPLYSLPVVGSANCGPANIYAEQNIDQYLKVSSNILPRNKKSLYVLIADGSSMNTAEIDGKTIESGDFVLVDSEIKNYKNGEIVVAVVDGLATIKKYYKDGDQIHLEPDSTDKFLPIYLHEGDDFLLNGKVVGVIKRNNKK